MNISLLKQQKVPLPWYGNAATQTTALQHTIQLPAELHRVLSSAQGTIS